jgi:hypothetical protein
MPAPNKDAGLDFAAALSAAQTPPQPVADGVDLPDGFPLPIAKTHRVIDSNKDPTGVPGALAYDYHVQRKVFVIYRPYWECNRCRDDMLNNMVSMPKEGDYECPHVHIKGYQEVVDKALAGQIIIGPELERVLKDGTILVSLKWWEQKLNHKRMRQLQREAARERGDEPPSGDDEEEPKK